MAKLLHAERQLIIFGCLKDISARHDQPDMVTSFNYISVECKLLAVTPIVTVLYLMQKDPTDF